jgi:hypothetical protein
MRRSSWLLSLLVVLSISGLAAAPELTAEQWALLEKGELVKEVKNEGGTQSGAHSFGLFKHSPATMWKVLVDLEHYDEFIERTTVSALLDEASKDRVVKSTILDAGEIEKLFDQKALGYKRIDGEGKWTVYSYQRNEFPWPVDDRWVLLEISHDDKTMTQKWLRLAGNMKEDFGSWRLYPAKNGATLGECEIHVDLDIPATGPFVSFGMDVTLPDTYKALDVMAQDAEKKAK